LLAGTEPRAGFYNKVARTGFVVAISSINLAVRLRWARTGHPFTGAGRSGASVPRTRLDVIIRTAFSSPWQETVMAAAWREVEKGVPRDGCGLSVGISGIIEPGL